ncbi:Small glutamine-rich tetratricopeptide repeat-containing protein 2 [Friedmanniomyces endolithicus]|uniref:Small glutamine-rich tetratricopeptide repeat-containing protein 2 n=1 Tax=Friedmanniomyces endolithicus TaxID=329885 RepID=A0AAN6FIX3_9PEZI|nr:Small glutamine-rich tetratricopeptide repeat-containing protein 2 [Friedmanniomyces endolithicus]KAK0282659.1 Small glutamine-rich tetratricopeptide repeat-containing protein 2 [Friedmanniomyces endolithicus]KAK0319233.1 Small glutamine-rich tetratricopeptide repeat-containing protein 2 [Friedmanniomyces endolithicus]KAK0987479.1 Small glutamine-rich tetratricopeptide repeat-containing protein 2 [Friedmanniomyces endolithicus]
MATDTHKRLALAIIDFLSTSLKDGTLQSEDADSIEIAQNCIAECFHVDPADQSAMKDALGGQNLLAVYGVYEKMKGKNTPSAQGGSSAAGATPSTSKSTSSTVPKAGEKGGPTDASEKLKGNGNTAMQRKDYKSAIDLYTQALEIAPLNPIYLSNRAAAYSANSQHELAKNDAELAVATDPKYTKAWSRLGLACFALGDAKASMEAYQKGIEAEGNGGSDAMKKGFETAKRRVEEEGGADDDEEEEDEEHHDSAAMRSAQGGGAGGGGMPDLGGLAAMLGGAGGGGAGGGGMPDLGGLAAMLGGAGGAGGGGMPDLSSIMQNPMMRQMAQSMMSNPEMMSNIMNNPQLRNMAGRFGGGGGGAAGGEAGSGGGGGGMPDLSAMMNDPNLAEMARNFMGGMGGAGAGRGAGRGAGGQ